MPVDELIIRQAIVVVIVIHVNIRGLAVICEGVGVFRRQRWHRWYVGGDAGRNALGGAVAAAQQSYGRGKVLRILSQIDLRN